MSRTSLITVDLSEKFWSALVEIENLEDSYRSAIFIEAVIENKKDYTTAEYQTLLFESLKRTQELVENIEDIQVCIGISEAILTDLTLEEYFLEKITELKIRAKIAHHYIKSGEAEIEMIFPEFIQLLDDAELIDNLAPNNKMLLAEVYKENTITFLRKYKDNDIEPEFLKLALNVFFKFNKIYSHPDFDLEKMGSGEIFDPTHIFCRLLISSYHSLSAKGFSFDARFEGAVRIGLEMMEERGKENYLVDGTYEDLSKLLIQIKLKEFIEEIKSEEDLHLKKGEIVPHLLRYCADSKKTPENIGIYILAFILSEDKELLKQTREIIAGIEDEETKSVCLNLLATKIFEQAFFAKTKDKKNTNYQLIKSLLEDERFKDFVLKKDDLFIKLLFVKTVLGEASVADFSARIGEVSVDSNLKDLENLLEILCYSKEGEKALRVMDMILTKPEIDANLAFGILAKFRDAFVYDSTLVDPEIVAHYYDRLGKRFSAEDPELLTRSKKIMFKIYNFIGNLAKANEHLEELAPLDAGFGEFKKFLAANIELDAEVKFQKLLELTKIISKEERDFLIEMENKRYTKSLIDDMKEIANQSRSVVAEEEVDRSKIKINGKEVDLEKCGQIEGKYYIYFDPDLLKGLEDSVAKKFQTTATTKSRFARDEGDNGVKVLEGKIKTYELKTKGGAGAGDERMIGTLIDGGKDEKGKRINIIYFNQYCGHAHAGKSALKPEIKSALDKAKSSQIETEAPPTSVAAKSKKKIKGHFAKRNDH